jgi:hypothetical protein
MAGQTTTCVSYAYPYPTYATVYYAMVDSAGIPFVRITIGPYDTGWVNGYYLENRQYNGNHYPVMSLSLGGIIGWIYDNSTTSMNIQCLAYWS